MGNDKQYRVFTRTWWRSNPAWPQGREPGAGPRHYRGHPQHCTLEEAQRYCKNWNATHDPGKLSYKAEFESR
jgi:hypothetical protein